jgi:hypothetical protein
MDTFSDLISSNNNGGLGEMLKGTFGGNLGHLHARKDSDFTLYLGSSTDMPSLEVLRDSVQGYYVRDRCTVIDDLSSELSFTIVVSFPDSPGWLNVIVTIRHIDIHRDVLVATDFQ